MLKKKEIIPQLKDLYTKDKEALKTFMKECAKYFFEGEIRKFKSVKKDPYDKDDLEFIFEYLSGNSYCYCCDEIAGWILELWKENSDAIDIFEKYLKTPTPININKTVWEILVPTISNEGKPYRLRYHQVWDEKVRAISGGLTILTPAKGQWISKEGSLYKERMIPVRVICTREQIESIVDITIKYYDQKAVLAYKIADEYILKHR